MQDKQRKPLNVALHGMDERSTRTMKMFFQGPCRNAAVIVQDNHAQADIVDLDSYNGGEKLKNQREKYPERPVIVLSLKQPDLDGVHYVRKPIKVPDMLHAIGNLHTLLSQRARAAQTAAGTGRMQEPAVSEGPASGAKEKAAAAEKSRVDLEERKKASKHRTAMQLDEKAFSSFVGTFAHFDPHDPRQRDAVFFNAKGYLQSYMQSAVKIALSNNRILKLNTGWKPIIIFPRTREVWVDADDKQLRSFCAVPLSAVSDFNMDSQGETARVTVTPVNPQDEGGDHDPEKFQSLDAFLWKVAIFTSKGRLPEGIDLDRFIYFKRWPNFTRFLLVPHALRVTALLMEEPRPLLDVANVLNIRHQYVFALFSAAYALGYAGQAVRQVDSLLTPRPVERKERSGLFGKILSRLRGK